MGSYVSYENAIDRESLTLEEICSTTQKRGLIFVRTVDGKYCLQVAPTLDASFDELANVHPPEVPNTVLMIAVRKSHCHVFLGGLDPGQAPLKTLLLMLRQT